MNFEINFIDVEYLDKRVAEPGYRRQVYQIGLDAIDAVRNKFFIRNWWRTIEAREIEEVGEMLPWNGKFVVSESVARNLRVFRNKPSMRVRIGPNIKLFRGFNIRRRDGKYVFIEALTNDIITSWAAAGYPEDWGCAAEANDVTEEKLWCAKYGEKYPREKTDSASTSKYSDLIAESLIHRNKSLAQSRLGAVDLMQACGFLGGAGMSSFLDKAAQQQLAMNRQVLDTTLIQDVFKMHAIPAAFIVMMQEPEITSKMPIGDPVIRFEWMKDPSKDCISTLLSPPHSPIQTILAKMFLTAVPEDIPVYYLIEVYYKTTDTTFLFRLYPTVKTVDEERSILWKFRALVPTAPEVDKIELSRAPDYARVYRMN